MKLLLLVLQALLAVSYVDCQGSSSNNTFWDWDWDSVPGVDTIDTAAYGTSTRPRSRRGLSNFPTLQDQRNSTGTWYNGGEPFYGLGGYRRSKRSSDESVYFDPRAGFRLTLNPEFDNKRNVTMFESDLGNYTDELIYPDSESCAAVQDVNLFVSTAGKLGHVTHFKNRLYFHPSAHPLDSTIPREYKVGINRTFTWIQARNYCRKLCMEPISVESFRDYYEMIQNQAYGGLPYFWTSGRRCAVNGDCSNHESMHPLVYNGWFWTNSGNWLSTELSEPLADRMWGYHRNDISGVVTARLRQPDNGLKLSGGADELCIMGKQFANEIEPTLHDFSCEAEAFVICQSSPQLCSLHGLTCEG